MDYKIGRYKGFLEDIGARPLPLKLSVSGFSAESLFVGRGSLGLEIAVLSASDEFKSDSIKQAFKKRKGGRGSPVLIVALHNEGATLCGTSGDQPPVFHTNDVAQAARLCQGALKLPDRNAAIRYLANAMPSLGTPLPGISNEGLLSSHELIHGTRQRTDWANATKRARQALGKSNKELIAALGFKSKPLDNLTELLLAGENRTALAILLKDNEVPEISADRFNSVSPVSYALTKADKERLPWVLMVQDDRVRLYNTENIGVGRRGRTETYIECQPSLLADNDIALLWLLFSSDALKKKGTVLEILKNSRRFAEDVADRLRERIYETVVPQLAMGIVKSRKLRNPTRDDLKLTYEMALMVLFRLLFIAYAEDRDLLPYKGNEMYQRRSLKQKAIELAEVVSKQTEVGKSSHHWTEASQLWLAVSHGNKEWGVPAYNGAIFSSDRNVSQAGAELEKIALPNRYFERALCALLLTDSAEAQYAPVDFRSLSVREFGTIYEGLLESELSLAAQDLTQDNKNTYLPAGKTDEVFVKQGDIYLHDRSGARKTSGSYYTPEFAVEHLLDETLEPALDEHLKRLAGLGDADRAEQFFDFRVADIAMGSGHFLVAAIDRIERRFALWLEENPTPGVTQELQDMREAAKTQLGELADQVVIEDGQLLRRMIARRCIYGVDLNPLTVQLARLSIWIHTFVPGLPLSLLDHNLVHGNSLVGIGSLDEIRKKFDECGLPLLPVDADSLLGRAAEPLSQLAKLSDASIKDIETGRKLMKEARQKTLETKALCDLITAQPVADDPHLKGYAFEAWEQDKKGINKSSVLKLAQDILEPLSALHFPVAFPEVFLGRSQGFNVVVGNPPWGKIMSEKHNFLTRYYPGLQGLSSQDFVRKKEEIIRNRPDLVEMLENEKSLAANLRNCIYNASYCIISRGHPDLYTPFCFRFLSLVSATNGRFGVVMPRSSLYANGSSEFRRKLFSTAGAVDATILQNANRWVFNIDPRYTIALVSVTMTCREENEGIAFKGPFTSLASFSAGKKAHAVCFPVDEVLRWDNSFILPLLPTPECADIFRQLQISPRLDSNIEKSWRARPLQEMNATSDTDKMDFSDNHPEGFWPVYGGASFNLWEPDTGTYYAWADPKVVLPWLYQKRLRSNQGKRNSVHREFSREYVEDKTTLAPNYARIAFRLVANRTNNRTMVCALTPPNVFHGNQSQVVLMPRGDKKDEAFLLGVLSSIPLDWYARRFVEMNFNFFLFNLLPVPRPKRSHPLWRRVVKLSGRLACPDVRFADWAAQVGVDYGSLEPDDKQDKIYELDAVVAHLYGLTQPQLIHIYETFHKGWDYQDRLQGVLKHYNHWKRKM